VEDALELWMGCFFGHHGKPVLADSSPLKAAFLDEDVNAVHRFVEAVHAFLGPTWPLALLEDEAWRMGALAPLSWQLAGLAVIADWLGSNAYVFNYCTAPMALETYWEQYALGHAETVLAGTGLIDRPVPVQFPGFRRTFGFEPTPLQSWAEEAAVPPGPQLILLEDITGAGKTEAALSLAHRLMATSCGDGLYFALPTMATSNAMYERLGRHYRSIYPADSEPSLVLAHGSGGLNQSFTETIVREPNRDRSYGQGEASAGAECRAWFADNRKKALLAEVGVGTVDQALLGVLPRKHQSLRLLGLRRKVLVVDEVHAYDTYTSSLLCTLLEAHASQGGSAILLSATLPATLRSELTGAWARGRALEGSPAVSANEFPLVTQLHDRGYEEVPVATRASSARDLPVAFLGQDDEALRVVLEAVEQGQCVCWIRNTVDDAIDAYRRILEFLPEPGHAQLFHARFTMADRQRIEEEALARFGEHSGSAERAGRVLVATQVVEQSLDLDFDVLVTDLAPIDLLIQRAGRLHRHRRDPEGNRAPEASGDGRSGPVLYVRAPSWTEVPPADWVRADLQGTSFVYPDPALLWRTCLVLREHDCTIQLPESARALLEGVYAADAPLPDGLADPHYEQFASRRVAASGARFNALRIADGYSLRGAGAGWDDDQEIGTRLSDQRTINVVLVRESEGKLSPRHIDHPHPWAMSTLKLREGQARRLPELPAHLQQEAAALRDEHPALRFSQFWLPDAQSDEIYDEILGALPKNPDRTGVNA
jgi:CRISPR-associated endonuclease/helicase Cas3